MALYFIVFDGPGGGELERDFPSREAARDGAISLFGQYLYEHPEYAYKNHWRVDLRDHDRRLLLHVIVASVDAPPPLNFRSVEG